MGLQRVRHDWATGLDRTPCPSLGSGLGLYHRIFPPLEAPGSSFTPFSLCLLVPGGQVIPYLLGDFGKTEHEKLSPFFLFLLKSPSLRMVLLTSCLLDGSHERCRAIHCYDQVWRHGSHFDSMEEHRRGSRCSYLALCVCSAEPTLLWVRFTKF